MYAIRPSVAFTNSLFIELLVAATLSDRDLHRAAEQLEPKVVKHGVLDEMCCEAFCRGLCSILSSSAILVLDIVDVAVGGALILSPLLWSYVTAAPATVALPSYGACLVILSAISLFGVRRLCGNQNFTARPSSCTRHTG